MLYNKIHELEELILAAPPRPLPEARCLPVPAAPGPAAAQADAHFLQDDPLGVGRAAKRIGLQRRAQVSLLVLLVVPLLVAAVAAQLASGAETTALPCGRRDGKLRRRSEAQAPRCRPATRSEMATPLWLRESGAARAIRLRDK